MEQTLMTNLEKARDCIKHLIQYKILDDVRCGGNDKDFILQSIVSNKITLVPVDILMNNGFSRGLFKTIKGKVTFTFYVTPKEVSE